MKPFDQFLFAMSEKSSGAIATSLLLNRGDNVEEGDGEGLEFQCVRSGSKIADIRKFLARKMNNGA